MVRGRRWVNLAVFVLLVGVAVWWVSHNWSRTAAGGAAAPTQAPVARASGAAGLQAVAALDGVPSLAASSGAAARGSGAARRPSGSTALGGASGGHIVSSTGGRGSAATGREAQTAGASSSATAYFAAARMQRAQAESRELDQLQAMANDPSASATVRGQAQEALLQLDTMQREEALAEMVLRAKGFSQSIVFLSASGAVVVVQAPRFDAAMAASVGQAVAEVASLQPDQIQIVARS